MDLLGFGNNEKFIEDVFGVEWILEVEMIKS
jgi:hypothetical protein